MTATFPTTDETQLTGRILVVDDEAEARSSLRTILASKGHKTASAPSPLRALSLLTQFRPDVVLTDVRMPGMDGMRFLEEVRERRPEAVIVMMSGYPSVPDAVQALKAGAESYLEKPLNPSALLIAIEQAVEKARHRADMRRMLGRGQPSDALSRILGHHPSVDHLREMIRRIAPTSVTVLITGETGTGKELAAAAIHELSPRANGPLVKLNCAALAESILESELFGHERGSFTGAFTRREGRFMQADGGTLVLDEASEIPARTQVKLLRFLQEKEFERVGGNETLRTDARLVAATNRDLGQAVKDGNFREDLFYRLNIVQLEVPPLRKRVSDIPLLAGAMLARFSKLHGKQIEDFSAEALDTLQSHQWPGNVRELENTIERAVVMATDSQIRADELMGTATERRAGSPQIQIPGSSMAEIEREAILKTLETVHGSTSRAAAMLGISPRKIQYKLREYSERV